MTSSDEPDLLRLYRLNLIPLHVILSSLVWVLHDYFITLEDEVRIYYLYLEAKTLFIKIHVLMDALLYYLSRCLRYVANPSKKSEVVGSEDPIMHVAGAISLWSLEIIMQLRIYGLFNCSKRILLFNAGLFVISIGLFLWILVVNAINRNQLIASDVYLPLLGCPVVNSGSEWAQWIPASIFEFVLFSFAIYKGIASNTIRIKIGNRFSLGAIIISENVVYFFSITFLLLFNNLMVMGATKIPWFGFGPFHAAMGILTSRMLIHLRKFSTKNFEGGRDPQLPTICFSDPPMMHVMDVPGNESESMDEHVSMICHNMERAFPVIEST